MTNHLNFGVSSFQVLANLSRGIAAAVVHNDDLPAPGDLGEDL